MIQPYRMADEFRREPMAVEGVRWRFHAGSLTRHRTADQSRLLGQCHHGAGVHDTGRGLGVEWAWADLRLSVEALRVALLRSCMFGEPGHPAVVTPGSWKNRATLIEGACLVRAGKRSAVQRAAMEGR
jgi:hypothetical protein